MFLHCVSQRVSGLPLAPLEVHTLGHSGCALIMYILWLSKPLDVRASTLVSIPGADEQMAFMLANSLDFGGQPRKREDRPAELPDKDYMVSRCANLSSDEAWALWDMMIVVDRQTFFRAISSLNLC